MFSISLVTLLAAIKKSSDGEKLLLVLGWISLKEFSITLQILDIFFRNCPNLATKSLKF